ncbi:hypothetical protein ACXYMO_08555 [Arenibacterium sp. CAU 1754]
MADTVPIPLLIPDNVRNPDANLYDASSGLGLFLSGLEQNGIGWHEMPDDFREVGTLNTACGGLRSNGSRTSLRNLVALEGLEFTVAFLKAADAGAERLNWNFRAANPFKAELEWLSLVGKHALQLLEEDDNPLHLLAGVGHAFFADLKLTDYQCETIKEHMNVDLREIFDRSAANGKFHHDNHNARIFSFVMTHPTLELVPLGQAENVWDTWDKRVAEVADLIRKQRPRSNRMSFPRWPRKPDKFH